MSSRFASRADLARELAASGKIRVDGDSILVSSSDGNKREYAVRLIDGRVVCNCEDSRRGHECKHARAAALWVAQQAEEMSKV
jgi:ribosomal 50S subunit-recycling heat shock protein